MKFAANDGVNIYFEDTGETSGDAIIFAHEFAAEVETWYPQFEAFTSQYRCVAFNARGWPPSDVPDDPTAYSQDRQVSDIIDLMDHLGIAKAHIVGLSMGSTTTLLFGISHADRALSLTIASTGYGAVGGDRATFHSEIATAADKLETEGWGVVAPDYGNGPFRRSFAIKEPQAHAAFLARLANHSGVGSARTMRTVQMVRPAFPDIVDDLHAMDLPVLLVVGDDDAPAIEGTLYLKKHIPTAGLFMVPRSGHMLNLEETEAFNLVLGRFLRFAADGTWNKLAPDQDAGMF
ncbi:MAG: alpha/beta fold hydrolase [Alphaproteobacteria bacterium]|jgi:pimeloyl-ACP methyl ester carboxylesterase|nr:alpha/beta fold hydrolase [Alphaproteobacteria bacterium]MBT4082389.1 alpha/beta fold hydrolase [Alphaproteobacteria bacterium]MBT4545931.1 alpha/beta fold hydrolase [Alphaproteobacteria bacterium]